MSVSKWCEIITGQNADITTKVWKNKRKPGKTIVLPGFEFGGEGGI